MKKNFFVAFIVISFSFFLHTSFPLVFAQDNSFFTVFSKPLFEFISSEYIPTTAEQIQKITVKVAKDQYQSATFALYAKQDLNNLTIQTGDLVDGSGHILSRNDMDLRIVKIWPRVRYTSSTAPPTTINQIPELLVYDDTEVIEAGTFATGNVNSYIPPSLSQIFHTDIDANNSKQFWLTVRTAKETSSGTYRGNFRVSADGVTPQDIPVEVTVLPFVLSQAKKDFIIYYDGTVEPTNFTRTESYIQKELDDLQSHGITGLKLVKPNTDALDKMYSLIKAKGFSGPIIVSGGIKTYDASDLVVMQKYGYEPIFYGIDEPNANHPDRVVSHLRLSYNIHQANGKVSVAIGKEQSDHFSDPNDPVYDMIDPQTGVSFRSQGITHEQVDFPNYDATNMIWSSSAPNALRNYITGLKNGNITKDPRQEYYYWQVWWEKPEVNRMMSGYFLWNSRLNGVYPWIYYRISLATGDPFTQPGVQAWDYTQTMTVYPSYEGPVPTIRWEGFREGVNDIRYVTTLQEKIDQLGSSTSPSYISLASDLRQALNTELNKYNTPNDQKTGKIGVDEYNKSRDIIVSLILEAENLLHTAGADGNSDGEVDEKDYEIWFEDYLLPAGSSYDGDYNKDQVVDGEDYVVWLNSFNQ